MLIKTLSPECCPEIERLSALSSFLPNSPGASPLFFDIETTGLSPETSWICLIGVLWYQHSEKKWKLRQWLIDQEEEENALIQAFLDYSGTFSSMIQYHGRRFDLPFLEARCKRLSLSITLPVSIDLYEVLKPCNVMFQLSHLKQTDLEGFLQLPPRRFPGGKRYVQFYKTWQSGHSHALEEAVLGHNQEDLLALCQLTELLGYLTFFQGSYLPESCLIEGSRICFHLRLPMSLPVPCSLEAGPFALQCKEQWANVSFIMKEQSLRQYYENYRDYVYLPAEDTAVPKAIGGFLDRSLKRPARPESCYTWFPVTDDFLNNSDLQLKFLRHALPFYLKKYR